MTGAPVILIGQPTAAWEVVLLSAQTRFSALSAPEPVVASVKAFNGGAPVDPTGGTVAFAFMADQLTRPGGGDWKAGTWNTNEIGEYFAQCEIGAGGVAQPTAGTWWVWVKVVLSPVTRVSQAGSIVVY